MVFSVFGGFGHLLGVGLGGSRNLDGGAVMWDKWIDRILRLAATVIMVSLASVVAGLAYSLITTIAFK